MLNTKYCHVFLQEHVLISVQIILPCDNRSLIKELRFWLKLSVSGRWPSRCMLKNRSNLKQNFSRRVDIS